MTWEAAASTLLPSTRERCGGWQCQEPRGREQTMSLQLPSVAIQLHPADDDEDPGRQDVPELPSKAALQGVHQQVDRLRRMSTDPELAARVCMDRPVLTVTDCYGLNRNGSIALKAEKPAGARSGSRLFRSIQRRAGAVDRAHPPPTPSRGPPIGPPGPGRRLGFTTPKKKTRLKPRVTKALASLFPVIGWVREYKKDWIVCDILSGVTAAIFQVPQGLANAMVSKVPSVMGLYTSFFPTLIYSFFGTSRQTSIGTFTVLGLLVGQSIQKYSDNTMMRQAMNGTYNETFYELARHTKPNPVQIAITLSLLSGLVQLLLGVLRLGKLGVLISPPLASGFTAGCAVQIVVSQLKGMLGLTFEDPQGIGAVVMTMWYILVNLKYTNGVVAGLSASVMLVLIVGKDFINPRIQKIIRAPLPWDLIVVIISVVVSKTLKLNANYKVPIVAVIPKGLPGPVLPPFTLVVKLIPDAISVGLVGFIITFSLAMGLAKKYDHRVDANQELLAMGGSNILGGAFCCFPACGSLARSSVLESVGCKTQLTGMICAVCMVVVLYCLGPYLEPLPKCVLATTLGTAVKDYLISVREIWRLWPYSRPDSIVWALTFLSVSCLDVSYGLIIGVITALFTITWRMHSYRGVVLKEFQSSGIFVAHSQKKSMSLAPDMGDTAVFRFASPLCFATVGHFERDFLRLLSLMQRGRRQKTVAVDCSAVCFVDASGVAILNEMIDECAKVDIEMLMAAIPDKVLLTLEHSGTLKKLGYQRLFLSLQDATRASRHADPLGQRAPPIYKDFLQVNGNSAESTHM